MICENRPIRTIACIQLSALDQQTLNNKHNIFTKPLRSEENLEWAETKEMEKKLERRERGM